jgi:hypothetical protein
MNRNDWELTVGSMLILAAGVVLFAPLVTAFAYPDVVLAVVTLVAAVGGSGRALAAWSRGVTVGTVRRRIRYSACADAARLQCDNPTHGSWRAMSDRTGANARGMTERPQGAKESVGEVCGCGAVAVRSSVVRAS